LIEAKRREIMKSLWNGAISFGLVNIPVSLYSAVGSNELKFSLIDSRDDHRINYLRINEVTGEEVPWDKIGKAFEFDDGNYVVMTDEDFVKADVSASKTLAIETFIKKEELSFIYPEKPYYIVPDKGAEKPYILLREAMKKTGRIAVARVVIHTKGYLSVIFFQDDILVLDLIRFHDEIRSIDELNIPHTWNVSDKEMELAENLINNMTEAWRPDQCKDEYRDAVMKRIEKKSRKLIAEDDEKDIREDTAPGKIIDILDLLKKSVEVKFPSDGRKVKKA
jgi:DNA end-binding protein Ku